MWATAEREGLLLIQKRKGSQHKTALSHVLGDFRTFVDSNEAKCWYTIPDGLDTNHKSCCPLWYIHPHSLGTTSKPCLPWQPERHVILWWLLFLTRVATTRFTLLNLSQGHRRGLPEALHKGHVRFARFSLFCISKPCLIQEAPCYPYVNGGKIDHVSIFRE